MHKEHHGIWLALLAVLCSSGMSVFIKLCTTISTGTIIFARFFLCLPVMGYVAYKMKIRFTLKDLKKNLIRSCSGVFAMYAYYFALKRLPLVNAVTLMSTAPLFLPLLVLTLSRRVISRKMLFALAIGFLGVIVVLRPSGKDFFVLASIAGLLGGFFRALATYNVRKLALSENTEKILVYYFFIGTALAFIPMLIDYHPVKEPFQWIYVLCAGIFALGYQYVFTKACSFTPATKVSSISYINVVLGGFFGWLIFQEVPSLWTLVGALLIIGGAILALLDKTPSRPLR